MTFLLTLNAIGATKTQIPGIIKRLKNAEPAIVPIPTSNCLKKITEKRATNNSGKELEIASKVAPLTSLGRLKKSPIFEELSANLFAAK